MYNCIIIVYISYDVIYYNILVGLRERGRKLERKKAASYLLASHPILSTSVFIRLELSMEDHVYKECLKSSKV